MSDQITLRVSPQVLLQASQIAHHTQQRIEEILSDWLSGSIKKEHFTLTTGTLDPDSKDQSTS